MFGSFFDQLQKRNLIHDSTPGTQQHCESSGVKAYVGFDPTADSLHIGNLAPVMLLTHLQRAGHTPVVLVGGATALIGDPSGRSSERPLLTLDQVEHNASCIGAQLRRFLRDEGENAVEVVNNADWFKSMKFIDFMREVGKHLSVSYMLSKDSVKTRLESGLSFTEFSYQLLQGFDFYHLWKHHGVSLQLGGSDQWGNITAGTELVRRKASGDVFALTCPLVTRADGSKFGKSASGENIWLDPARTSAWKFYQFWLNVADTDIATLLMTFSLEPVEVLVDVLQKHQQAPHTRSAQLFLAREMTERVHGKADLERAEKAANILFGQADIDELKHLPELLVDELFEGAGLSQISADQLGSGGVSVLDALCEVSKFIDSKAQARRLVKSGGISINRAKVTDPAAVLSVESAIGGRYFVLQRGKKQYSLIKIVSA